MFPVNRLTEYFASQPEPPVTWFKIAEGHYVAQALDLTFVLKQQPSGRFKWTVAKESSEEFDTEDLTVAALVAELRRSHVFLRHDDPPGFQL